LWDLGDSAQEGSDGTAFQSKHLQDQGSCLLDGSPNSGLLVRLYGNDPTMLQEPSSDEGIASDIESDAVPEIVQEGFGKLGVFQDVPSIDSRSVCKHPAPPRCNVHHYRGSGVMFS